MLFLQLIFESKEAEVKKAIRCGLGDKFDESGVKAVAMPELMKAKSCKNKSSADELGMAHRFNH